MVLTEICQGDLNVSRIVRFNLFCYGVYVMSFDIDDINRLICGNFTLLVYELQSNDRSSIILDILAFTMVM